MLKLSYVDKFLDDIHREVRDRYKNELLDKRGLLKGQLDLSEEFERIYATAEEYSVALAKQPKAMRSYNESKKSEKTVASMIETKGGKGAPPQVREEILSIRGMIDKSPSFL